MYGLARYRSIFLRVGLFLSILTYLTLDHKRNRLSRNGKENERFTKYGIQGQSSFQCQSSPCGMSRSSLTREYPLSFCKASNAQEASRSCTKRSCHWCVDFVLCPVLFLTLLQESPLVSSIKVSGDI